MKNKFLFFVDLETTGFSWNYHDIIQLSGIITDYELNELAVFDQFSRPQGFHRWSQGAEDHHGIPFHRANKFQDQRKMLIKFMHFLKPYIIEGQTIKFVCHAKNYFDYKFVKETFINQDLANSFNKAFSKDNYESTIDLAEKFKPATGLSNNKLNTVADHFNIELDHHEALSDANACKSIYKRFKGMKQGLGLFHEDN